MISLHSHERAFTAFMEPNTRFPIYSNSLPFTRTCIMLHRVFEIFNRFNKWADAITQIKFHLPQKLGLRPERSLKSISCFPNMTLLQAAYSNRSCLQPRKRQTHFKFESWFKKQKQILISLTTGFQWLLSHLLLWPHSHSSMHLWVSRGQPRDTAGLSKIRSWNPKFLIF